MTKDQRPKTKDQRPLPDEELMQKVAMIQKFGQQFCSDERLHKIFDADVESARKELRGQNGLQMSFTIHGYNVEEDKWSLMLAVMANWPPDDKTIIMKQLGAEFHKQYPEHMPMVISQSSEAWSSATKADEKTGEYVSPEVMPSEDPNRIEIYLVNTTTLDQRKDFIMEEMLRDKDGKITGFREQQSGRYDRSKPPENPANQHNYLISDLLMGYFESKYPGIFNK